MTQTRSTTWVLQKANDPTLSKQRSAPVVEVLTMRRMFADSMRLPATSATGKDTSHYYRKFLPNLSTLLHPLNSLLKDDQEWMWTQECGTAFQAAKDLLVSAPILAHYDPSLPLRMAGDASTYGIGAVLSHVFPDGREHPIAYASHTLSPTEQNYSQIEKEALSLVFGVHNF